MPRVPRAAVVSFRLACGDGVSVEAAKWGDALRRLGLVVTTVAGEGEADRLVEGLGIDVACGPDPADVSDALADADLVVVENLCSLPLNPRALAVLAAELAGRPALLHHHDLPWQRARFASSPPPPDDPAWRHVTINELSRAQLASRGIVATTVYNAFDPDPPPGRRTETRAALGVAPGERLVLQPTRALDRKRVDAAVALAESLGAVYWLLGAAEDGYGPELERVLGAACCPVRRGRPTARTSVADAYAACDAVVLLSNWEGFGNPAVESATHRRPLCIGPYPVAAELVAFGFEWFAEDEAARLDRWLAAPDPGLLERNAAVARRHFNVADLPGRLEPLVRSVGVAVDAIGDATTAGDEAAARR